MFLLLLVYVLSNIVFLWLPFLAAILSTRNLFHSPIHLGPANHKHCPLKDHKGGKTPPYEVPSQAIQTVGWRNGYPKRNKPQNPSPLDIAPLSPFKPNATTATCNDGFALLLKQLSPLKVFPTPSFLIYQHSCKTFPVVLTIDSWWSCWCLDNYCKQ